MYLNFVQFILTKQFWIHLLWIYFDVCVWAEFSSQIPGQRISFQRLSVPNHQNSTLAQQSTIVTADNDGLMLQGSQLYHATIFQASQGHFNRERIPERVVHAKGFTYYGTFRVTNPEIVNYTKASVFNGLNKHTKVAVRFSTQLGEKGSSDTPFGEVRGLGVKFYTDNGIFDLLCINIPVFFINDPQMFVHLVHAQKRDPRSNLRDSNNLWDFFSLRPETLNAITFVYSDYGLPNGFRFMPAFSVNTFSLVNDNGQRYFVRFMFLPMDGIKNLNRTEAFHLSGIDPDYGRRDLFERIERKQLPSWRLYIQSITSEEVDNSFSYNPFDTTKLWPLDRFPPIEIGIMTLNENVQNAFAEDEQIALNPANLVPGIEPSPDRLLLGRMFAYLDTQFYRLGANHLLIPINRGQKKFSRRDGAMRTDGNSGSTANFYPNSRFLNEPWRFDMIPAPFSFDFTDLVLIKPDTLQLQYEHARETYHSFTADEQVRLHQNLAFALSSITRRPILERMLEHFQNISPQYANGIWQALMEYG